VTRAALAVVCGLRPAGPGVRSGSPPRVGVGGGRPPRQVARDRAVLGRRRPGVGSTGGRNRRPAESGRRSGTGLGIDVRAAGVEEVGTRGRAVTAAGDILAGLAAPGGGGSPAVVGGRLQAGRVRGPGGPVRVRIGREPAGGVGGVGDAPALLVHGCRGRDSFRARGHRRWRCRRRPITSLVAFTRWCRAPGRAPSSQPQRREDPAERPTRSLLRDLRLVMRLPSDGSRLPSPTPPGGAEASGYPAEPARRPSRPHAAAPASIRATPALDDHSVPARCSEPAATTGHGASDGQRPSPARVLDPAATYRTTLTAPAGLLPVAPDRRRRVTGRAAFAPAHRIAGGSGGRSQRSLP
jgi:hypothetical protein